MVIFHSYVSLPEGTGWSDHPIIPYHSHDRLCHDCLQEPLDESLGALPADETPEADPSDSDGLGWDSRNRNKNTKKFNVFRLLNYIPDGIHSIFNIPQYSYKYSRKCLSRIFWNYWV